MAKEEIFELSMPEVSLPSPDTVRENFKAGFGGVIAKVDKEIAAMKADASTKEGREKLVSLAYKISKTKTGLEKRAIELADPQKKIVKAIDEERKFMRDELDKRRDNVRAPVTAWEEKEKKRQEMSDQAFDFLYKWKSYELNGKPLADMGSAEVEGFMKSIEPLIPADPKVFGDDLEDYEALVRQTLVDISARIERLKSEERDREELAKLRAEREEREAAEAKARAEQEEAERLSAQKAKLAKEAEDKAKREAEETVQAERRKAEAAKQAQAQAEADKAQAEANAKASAEMAAKQAEEEKQRAIQAERNRQEQEALAAKEEERRRAADLKLRKSIHDEIISDLIEFSSITRTVAERVLQAMDDGTVRNIKINY